MTIFEPHQATLKSLFQVLSLCHDRAHISICDFRKWSWVDCMKDQYFNCYAISPATQYTNIPGSSYKPPQAKIISMFAFVCVRG